MHRNEELESYNRCCFCQTYRLIIPLVARLWCLRELCSRKDLVDLVTDPHAETIKEGIGSVNPLDISYAVADLMVVV